MGSTDDPSVLARQSTREPRYSFTQPICGRCYDRRYPGRGPVRIVEPDPEVCCDCGGRTDEGIFIRVDPATVFAPTRLRDE